MEILFMVFMVVVSIMALFAVIVVLRDIVKEILASKKEKPNNSAVAIQQAERIVETTSPSEDYSVATVEKAHEEQTVEEKKEESADLELEAKQQPDEPQGNTEGTISFAMGQQQTLEEKYLALSGEARAWYDEIIKYASAVEGSKRFKTARYEEYKLGKNRLVRLLIKRGIIHCEFILHNSDFKNYISENKISVRQSATTMLVESARSVDAVKNSIDIVVAAIAEEREYKKRLARERRRARGASETLAETTETKTQNPAQV